MRRVALTYLILLKTSESFVEDDGQLHAVYCLRKRRRIVVFYADER